MCQEERGLPKQVRVLVIVDVIARVGVVLVLLVLFEE